MKGMATLMAASVAVAAFGIGALAVAQPPGPMGGPMGPGMGRGIMLMDQNGDGKVSKQEFVKAHEDRFKELDANGDGFIDAQEARSGPKGPPQGLKAPPPPASVPAPPPLKEQ